MNGRAGGWAEAFTLQCSGAPGQGSPNLVGWGTVPGAQSSVLIGVWTVGCGRKRDAHIDQWPSPCEHKDTPSIGFTEFQEHCQERHRKSALTY